MDRSPCAECGKQEDGAVKLMACSRCKQVVYCSKECQILAWKVIHKKVCGRVGGGHAKGGSGKKQKADSSLVGRPSKQAHSIACTCADCGGSGHGGRMMLWRDKNGVNTFTGIVEVDGDHCNLIKLDDPSNVEGSGHLMGDDEYFSEGFHYDEPSRNSLRYNIKVISPILVDFADKPSGYKDGQEAEFDVKFPFGGRKPLIRSDDSVWVKAFYRAEPVERFPRIEAGSPEDKARNGYLSLVEGFWVYVVSVTATGMVTGISNSTLHVPSHNVDEDDWIAFPVEKVLGMKKGKHWNSQG